MIRFPPATVLDAAAIDRLREGSPTQRDAADAIDQQDPSILVHAIEQRWKAPRLSSGTRRFIECTLRVDRLDGPFDLRGVSAALTEPLLPLQTLGVIPAGLEERPLPWLRIGSSNFGDFYLSLGDEQIGCFPPEVPSELWSEASDYDRASYERFHKEIFYGQGWSNDLGSLLAFQADCAAEGIEREAELDDRLEVLAKVGGALFRSKANVERFLSNRWFNLSRAQMRAVKSQVASRPPG
ncbi:MAG: hypothetical protein AB1Z98_15440 [Nannocystaceae bacterium]